MACCAHPQRLPASAEGADCGVLGAQVVAQLCPGRVRPQSCAEGLLARTLLALPARLLSGCGERATSGRRWPALCGGVRQAFAVLTSQHLASSAPAAAVKVFLCAVPSVLCTYGSRTPSRPSPSDPIDHYKNLCNMYSYLSSAVDDHVREISCSPLRSSGASGAPLTSSQCRHPAHTRALSALALPWHSAPGCGASGQSSAA